METRDERAWFAEFVAGRGVRCPGCGYDLRDLKEPVCPECGRGLVIGLHFAEPRLAWFVTAVVGAAVGVGFHGMVLAYYTFGSMTGVMYAGWEEFRILLIGLTLCGGWLGLLVAQRRRIERKGIGVRCGAAALGWAAALFSTLWFFSVVG